MKRYTMKTLYNDILRNLEQGKAVVEVTIIEQNGSAPRTAGTKMLVFEDESQSIQYPIIGTIGGGLYEAKAIATAREMLVQKKERETKNYASIQYYDLQTKPSPTDMDMICGGELRLLMEYIAPSSENITFYQEICKQDMSGKSCVVIHRLQNTQLIPKMQNTQNIIAEKALYFSDSNASPLNSSIIPSSMGEIWQNKHKIPNLLTEEHEYVFDVLSAPHKLYIFGAGHVSCELVKIAQYLDFQTVVLDDRQEFCNTERFPLGEVVVLQSLNKEDITEFLNQREVGARDGIIIVTRGHARDKEALECSLTTKAGYIGMIGSKSKRKSTYEHLLSKGFTQADFEKVHSPIGLSIGAQSPEEIAISITAELIMWRSGKLSLA